MSLRQVASGSFLLLRDLQAGAHPQRTAPFTQRPSRRAFCQSTAPPETALSTRPDTTSNALPKNAIPHRAPNGFQSRTIPPHRYPTRSLRNNELSCFFFGLTSGGRDEPNEAPKVDLHQLRIELSPRAAEELLISDLRRTAFAVGAIRDNGVDGIDDRDQTSKNRDLLPSQSIRISHPIGALMVVPDGHQEFVEKRKVGKWTNDVLTPGRMTLHLLFFMRIEFARLVEDPFRNSNLADIVKVARVFRDQLILHGESSDFSKLPRGLSDALAMRSRIRIVSPKRFQESTRDRLSCLR